MTVTVKLSDVLEGMELQSDQSFAYIDRQSGRLLQISEEDIRIAEDEEVDDDIPVWQQSIIQDARAIINDASNRYLALPDRFEIDEWSLMRTYCENVKDETSRERLLDAIHGRGAFRMFKDAVHRLQLADDWYAFRDTRYRAVAIEWCQRNGLDVDEGA